MSLARMSDLIRLDLAVSQVQDNNHPSLAYVGEWSSSFDMSRRVTNLPWVYPQGIELSLYKLSYTWRLKL
jgi:hypothetical protein